MSGIAHWLKQPFHLLASTQSRLKLVIFCGLFGCIFLNVFLPFNMGAWFIKGKAPLYIIITFFSAAGVAALALTQFGIRSLFKIKDVTRGGFIAWLALDLFAISLAMLAVNSIFTEHSFFEWDEYLITLKYTVLVLVLPYSLGILILYLQEQLRVVQELKLKVTQFANLENIVVMDEAGRAVVTMNSRKILYFKSEDNYVLLFYRLDETIKKELIRTNLKKLEQELNFGNFIRIHRSYMINTQNLVAATKTSKGYQVMLDADTNLVLPVSVTYQNLFLERCIQKAS
ncbi:MAG: LytTR family transcriptional regulator [Bacteroidetes bacterium]|nr:LytTR family transcriptional regulator [Bacteroidota bacterium]